MTTPAGVQTKAETPSVGALQFRALIVGGIALAAGLWATSQIDRRAALTYSGRLQARMVTITAQQPARLQKISVSPGQRVSAGTPLFVLESEEALEQAALRRQDAEQKRQIAIRVKAAADLELHWRRRELQAEIFQTQLRMASMKQEKLHLDVAQVAWREQLSSSAIFRDAARPAPVFRFISDPAAAASEERVQTMLQEDAAAAAAQALASQIALCEQRLDELRRLDALLESQIRTSHGVDRAEEDGRIAAEAVSREADETETAMAVSSPSYGLVGLMHHQPGDRVATGDLLVQVLDDDRRSIEVEVPSSAVNRFQPGQAISLKFPGAEMRTGVISAIPPQTSTPRGEASDSLVTLVIEPSGRLWPQVPIGSQVLVYQP